jgi:hypothetical protein
VGASEKHAAAFHPGDGPTPRIAADVLREHQPREEGWGWSCSGEDYNEGDCLDGFAQHQADMLAAAGLLTSAEPVVMRVHYGDSESHARSFNEGFETAVAQGLADDPTLATDWLAEHDAEVRRAAITEVWDQAQEAIRSIQQQHTDVAAKALRDAADDLQPGQGAVGLTVSYWLRARADRIAAGETP